MPPREPFKISELLLKAPEKQMLTTSGRRKKLLLWTAAVHAAMLLLPLGIWSVGNWLFSRPKKEFITVTISEPNRWKNPRSSGKAPRLRPPKAQPKPARKAAPKATKAKPIPAKTSTKKARQQSATPPPQDPWEDLKPASQTQPESTEATPGDDELGSTYDENLVGTLYELWKPPSDALLAGRRPVVLTRITVNPAGKVLKAEILRRSGFAPMDESVQKLLNSLSELPTPPKGRQTFEIEFTPYE